MRKLFHNQRKSSDSKEKPTKVPKIIIMSATLNHDKFSEFLGGCPVFEIPGRCYPVRNIFLDYVGVKDLQTPNYLNRVSRKCKLYLMNNLFYNLYIYDIKKRLDRH